MSYETYVKESYIDEYRDLVGEDHNFSVMMKNEDAWNWMLRRTRDQYPKSWMQNGALFFGLVHGWLFQQTMFQWTPSMCRLTRTPIFALPTMFVWYKAQEFFEGKWTDYHQDRHTMHQYLLRSINSARHEAYKQQTEGFVLGGTGGPGQ